MISDTIGALHVYRHQKCNACLTALKVQCSFDGLKYWIAWSALEVLVPAQWLSTCNAGPDNSSGANGI